MDLDAFEKLLNLYFDEGLDEEMTRQLDGMLLSSPEAREEFWRQSRLHATLRQVGQESWGNDVLSGKLPEERETTSLPLVDQPALDRAWLRPALLATAALVVALVSITAFQIYQHQSPEVQTAQTVSESGSITLDATRQEAIGPNENESSKTASVVDPSHRLKLRSPRWVAVVRREVEVVWEHALDAMVAGEVMPPRRIKFKSGLMEIQTDRGVVITVEGPADLEVVSGMEVICREGRLRADVPPPAIGFVFKTPQFDVVDLGTSFAMEIGRHKRSEVHVIKGLVQIVPDSKGGKAKRDLREGNAIGVTDGVFKDIESDGDAFPSSSKLEQIVLEADRRQRDSWARKQRALAADPDCLVYFDFQNLDKGSSLINSSVNATPSSHGTIVGAQWARGRWPGKGGLEFRSLFDRVLFSISGQYKSLTFLASVRLDELDANDVALLTPSASSDGNFRLVFSPSAREEDAGNPRIDCKQDGSWDFIGHEPAKSFLRRGRLGTWAQVAFIWDGKSRVIDRYVNGARLPGQEIPEELLAGLRIGKMEIGNQNHSSADSSHSIQKLTGCIDEFAIIGRALSLQELRVYHIVGRTSWSHAGTDKSWDNPDNWHGNIMPGLGETVFIDLSGDDAASFNGESDLDLSSIRVGTKRGLIGELKIVSGQLNACRDERASSRVGVGGGDGRVLQQGGDVTVNSLEIGLDKNSQGSYRLEGGKLTIFRKSLKTAGSIDIGLEGVGEFAITGGTLETRGGILLGSEKGVGKFFVQGSKPERIAVGSFRNRDGFWQQATGSTLSVRIDNNGVTPIFVDDFFEAQATSPIANGNVTFADGSLLDVGFDGEPRSGSWDVMRWEGALNDNGIELAPSVDPEIWSYKFVDTDESGSPDTLRVTASVAR